MSAAKKLQEPASTPEQQLVGLATAAQRLSVCSRTLRRMIDRQEIRAIKIGYGRGVWRISVAEIDRIIAEGTIPV